MAEHNRAYDFIDDKRVYPEIHYDVYPCIENIDSFPSELCVS